MASKKNARTGKRQHTVPQTYLKFFTQDQKFLFVFDKKSKGIMRVSTKDAAVSKNFYDINPEAVEPNYLTSKNADLNAVDKILWVFEDNFARSLRRLNKYNVGDTISNDLRKDTAKYMAVQFLRTFEMRQSVVNLFKSGTQRMIDDLVRANFSPEFKHLTPIANYDENHYSALHAKFILKSISEYALAFGNHIWQIGIVNSDASLYTSDTPIVRSISVPRTVAIPKPIRSEGDEVISDLSVNALYPGISEAGVEIAFPLSSKSILLLKERSYFTLQGIDDNAVVEINSEQVELFNELQIEQSYRQIFCENSKFDLASKYCEKFPYVCDINRSRLFINSSYEISSDEVIDSFGPQKSLSDS